MAVYVQIWLLARPKNLFLTSQSVCKDPTFQNIPLDFVCDILNQRKVGWKLVEKVTRDRFFKIFPIFLISMDFFTTI